MLHKRITARIILALSVSGLVLQPARSTAQSFNLVTIDVPCASCPGGIARETYPGGINPAGDIVGFYTDAVGAQHGFLLARGHYTTFDVPGAVGTNPKAISPDGDIVGAYLAPLSAAPWGDPAYCPAAGSSACVKGFLLSHGHYTTILFPGHPGAVPQRITPNGTIYGCLHDFDQMRSMFGAVWTRSGQTSLLAGGGELSDPTLSYPYSMHAGATPDGKVIVGRYADMVTAHVHGYILQDGVLQTYDIPGSTLTAIWDINPKQEFVGTYVDAAGRRHGFVQFPDSSTPITIDYDNAVSTFIMGVNPEGAIVGWYTDIKGITHGLVGAPTGK